MDISTPEKRKSRLVQRFLDAMPASLRKTLSPTQIQALKKLLELTLQDSSAPPKLVDLRFQVDLLVARYYVALFVGQDRRQTQRNFSAKGITRVGNWIAAILILLGLNLLISAILVLTAYLIKSALGIDFFPGHFGQTK